MVNELAEHERDQNFNTFENFVKSFNDKNFKVIIAKKEKQCLGYAIFFRKEVKGHLFINKRYN